MGWDYQLERAPLSRCELKVGVPPEHAWRGSVLKVDYGRCHPTRSKPRFDLEPHYPRGR